MLWYRLLTLQRTKPLKFKMRFSQCIGTILVHICYQRKDGELHKKSIFYISDDKKHDTLFVQHCFKLHHADYCPWVLSFIAIGYGLMVLHRNLRQLDPSTSLQGKEIIHMIGTYNWKSILVILHSTSSIALVSYQYEYYMNSHKKCLYKIH